MVSQEGNCHGRLSGRGFESDRGSKEVEGKEFEFLMKELDFGGGK